MKKILLCVIVISTIVFIMCSSDGIGPEPMKDPRDFTWTIMDTVHVPGSFQIIMTSIWGSSPTDIYVCGHSSGGGGDLWHYDGLEWKEVDLFKDIDRSGLGLKQIMGFSSDDVWLAGARVRTNHNPPPNFYRKNLLAHWDGTRWKEYETPGDSSSSVLSIGGDAPNNVWACGYRGQIHHWNGSAWNSDSLYNLTIENSVMTLEGIAVHNGMTYIVGREEFGFQSNFDSNFFTLKGSLGDWEIVSSFNFREDIQFGTLNLYSTPYGKLYSYNWGLFELQNDKWVRIIHSLILDNPIRDMVALSEDNMLFACYEGAFHWNGTDLYKIEEIPGLPQNSIKGVWFDGQEAFFIGTHWDGTSEKSVVWHGK